jgi:hypothetical protein
MQKGYCLAIAFKRMSVSSSGGGGEGAFAFLALGCRAILAVANDTKWELVEVEVTVFGFI